MRVGILLALIVNYEILVSLFMNLNKELFTRLGIKELTLTSKEDWVEIIIPDSKVEESKRLAKIQEDSSRDNELYDHAFLNSREESLMCTTESKAAEFAVQEWGGGTARVTQPNEFHMYPDVGQVNVRHINDAEDSLMIMKKDQNRVPIVLVTGKMPKFYLIGWTIPAYAKQYVYRINLGREELCYGFLQNMQPHEACTFSKQWLFPMWSLSKDLVK
jgi:hypothetical protein